MDDIIVSEGMDVSRNFLDTVEEGQLRIGDRFKPYKPPDSGDKHLAIRHAVQITHP